MPEQFGDKTHEATPHRRDQAREQGQVPRSQDFTSAATLVGASLALMYLGGEIAQFLGELASNQLGQFAGHQADPVLAVTQWNDVVNRFGKVILPFFSVLVVLTVAINIFQVGFLLVPERLLPDIKRVDPIKGFSRVFSVANFVRLLFGIFKIAIVATIGGVVMWSKKGTILGISNLEVPQVALVVTQLTLQTCLWIGGALLVLALFDLSFQRWKYEQDLRMTTQEVKEEMKSLQGDPQTIQRRKLVQRELIAKRLSSSVPGSDFVVTNPTELAVAVKYDPTQMPAPIVVAKGAGVLAKRIRQLALENDIPVIERKPLAQALYKNVEVRQPVPPEQYAAVAEVLRYVYQLKGKTLPQSDQAA